MLEPLGLSTHAAEVYRAMLHRPDSGVEELVAYLDWPAEQVRSALDECARLSLIKPSWDEPSRLRVVSPEIGLQELLARREGEFLEKQRKIAESRVEVARFIDEYATAQQNLRSSVVERLDGIGGIRFRIEELTQECESELLTFAPGGGQSESGRKASRPLCEALAARGVVMRSVYLDSVHNDPGSVEHLRWLHTHGDEVRTIVSLPSRMLIFDRAVAVLPVDPDDSAAGAVVLRGHGIIATLCELFDHVWEAATPFSGGRPQPRESESEELSSQERAVLRLLGEGLTDEVVARKLGVSVRTGRRITAELMTRLGARSRFQAGVRAAQLGWMAEIRNGIGRV
ncbi:LuxR family transcriptional regulator [Streptomyces sp. ISL-98]|uniref:helix-turn-helix transcriptional regulator n=1 Tax=Streptomyces sp. ISL-98 TaxID=2819192 RepID=UPI001BE6803C|nr:LuxR family transcriptional regulator [Streptomyces sp. ISL-98]MBT2510620.1 LuxR family transcriptional regulator [Streptomyces sp. ISL-98]